MLYANTFIVFKNKSVKFIWKLIMKGSILKMEFEKGKDLTTKNFVERIMLI